jgi:four helix bundle protein
VIKDKRQESDARNGYGYRQLVVWQKGMELAKLIYGITRKFPGEERFGLVSQMRRAAVSIPSNVAEGQARHTTKEFVQFISHAEGSLAELDTQLRLGIDLGYCPSGDAIGISALMEEMRKMLNALRRNLTARER